MTNRYIFSRSQLQASLVIHRKVPEVLYPFHSKTKVHLTDVKYVMLAHICFKDDHIKTMFARICMVLSNYRNYKAAK
jgi:hypothetical protein